jgi:hypothetical protein
MICLPNRTSASSAGVTAAFCHGWASTSLSTSWIAFVIAIQTEQLVSSLTGVGWQRQVLQCALSRFTPQAMTLSQGVIECDRLQGVLQSRSHPHPLVTVSQ